MDYDILLKGGSTQKPAEVIRRTELGHLSVGAEADIAVLELCEGKYGFVDSGRARINGTQSLECRMTLRAGEVAWDQYGKSCPKWEDAGEYKRAE